MGLDHGHMLMGQSYEHMIMGLAHEHMAMGLAHEHMLMELDPAPNELKSWSDQYIRTLEFKVAKSKFLEIVRN